MKLAGIPFRLFWWDDDSSFSLDIYPMNMRCMSNRYLFATKFDFNKYFIRLFTIQL